MEIWSNAHKWYLDESSLGPGSAVGEKGTGSNRKNIGERSEPSSASRLSSLADFFPPLPANAEPGLRLR